MTLQRGLVIVGVALLPFLAARAHEAPAGWSYDAECCSTQDCAPVPDAAILEAPGGYSVLIRPGTHPMVPLGAAPRRAFFPHGDTRIRVSGDEHRHACVGRIHVFCIYVPPGSV